MSMDDLKTNLKNIISNVMQGEIKCNVIPIIIL